MSTEPFEHPRLRNIFHCTVHKAASQWVRALLTDPRVLTATGMSRHRHEDRFARGVDQRPVSERTFEEPFPPGTIVSPLYVHYRHYRAMPKPPEVRCVFVMRDPRDLIVSNYFSRKYSHALNPRIQPLRERLLACDDEEQGLDIVLAWLEDDGIFDVLDSWMMCDDSRVLVLRYEDLVDGRRGSEAVARMFAHLQIALPAELFASLMDDYRFERLSGGRRPGQEDIHGHLRKGIGGDWKNHFGPALERRFNERYEGLLGRLGYR